MINGFLTVCLYSPQGKPGSARLSQYGSQNGDLYLRCAHNVPALFQVPEGSYPSGLSLQGVPDQCAQGLHLVDGALQTESS